ncbi:MAG: hypothetical protein H7Z75_18420 [Ferruginibacter sp.]|nr:hypothetical protein [Cytophagales bacterium]
MRYLLIRPVCFTGGLLLAGLCLPLCPAKAQSGPPYALPTVEGMQRGRAVSLEYETFGRYSIVCPSDSSLGVTNGQEVSQNHRLDFKVKIPLLNRPSLKMVASLKFSNEEYRFGSSGTANEFYQKINDQNLSSYALSVHAIKSFDAVHYLVLSPSVESSGRYTNVTQPRSRFFRYTGSALFGWKRTPNLTYGLGFSYSYSPGIVSIAPVATYYRTFNPHWGLEVAIPAKVRVRYNASPRTLLYAGLEGKSQHYYLRLEESKLAQFDVLALRKTEVRLKFELERQLHDWIWLSVNAGLRQNINFRLSDPRQSQRQALIRPQVGLAPFVGFSLAMVVPQQFLK